LIWVKQSHHSSSTQRGWSGYVLSIDTFNNIYMTAGGESLGNGKMFFSKDTFSYTKNDPDPSIVLKLDTSGNILCSSFAISGGDDQSTLGVNPSGRYVYWCGDFQTTVILGKDTVIYYPNAGEFPFVARWQPCMCKISAFFSGKTNICRGEGTTLTGLGGTSYSWSTGSTEQSITVSPQVTTTYTLSATNGDCSGDTTITVTVEPLPSVNVCCNTTISAGDSVQLSASGGGSYVWYPSMGLSCDSCPNPIAKPSQTTTYTLIVTNDSGCTVETSVTVYIGEAGCGNVFVPDVFSPNQDGHNDVLYVRGNCIATMDFNVYDRWGNKVFESENTNNGWDGSHNGSPMNTATFVWYLKATLLDGTQLEKKGNVTLVR
jgi:gliding motility-associated-like protein